MDGAIRGICLMQAAVSQSRQYTDLDDLTLTNRLTWDEIIKMHILTGIYISWKSIILNLK